jgi:hypothetical protein
MSDQASSGELLRQLSELYGSRGGGGGERGNAALPNTPPSSWLPRVTVLPQCRDNVIEEGLNSNASFTMTNAVRIRKQTRSLTVVGDTTGPVGTMFGDLDAI